MIINKRTYKKMVRCQKLFTEARRLYDELREQLSDGDEDFYEDTMIDTLQAATGTVDEWIEIDGYIKKRGIE